MIEEKLKKELDRYIIDRFVNFTEYQNKYFLKKKIQEILTEATDEKVYLAIDRANQELSSPCRKKVYIDFLLNQLLG